MTRLSARVRCADAAAVSVTTATPRPAQVAGPNAPRLELYRFRLVFGNTDGASGWL